MRLLQLPRVAFLKRGFDAAPERFLLTDRAPRNLVPLARWRPHSGWTCR